MLDSIQNPKQIKKLNFKQLQSLAAEVRSFLIENVQKTGGHLASNLGAVDFTIAMHYVFNSPKDSFVFDVGHQAYTHKILTGRKNQMHTLRKAGGLSGFTKISESEHDAFGTGHSSTSISSALGIAIANKINNIDNKAIAIIGDGALTGGMSFEALNNAGDSNTNLLIILNDNNMSISKNVGAINKYLTKLISSKVYSTLRTKSINMLEKMPRIQNFAKKSEEHLKGMVLPGTLFEELGLEYFGLIDGHDLPTLIKTFKNLKKIKTPGILHIVTKKGYGLKIAENDPCKFHGIAPSINDTKTDSTSYSNIFGNWLINTATKDKKLIAITPAMGIGSGMSEFEKQFPDRYFDVGIAEQHAITFAGGLATKGFKPIVAIYSTFLQRGYDQLIHDIALQDLNVVFAIDRAGLIGSDGATHTGGFDLSFLRCIPNIVIMTPSNSIQMYKMLNTAYNTKGIFCVRYPKGSTNSNDYVSEQNIQIGKANIIKTGSEIAILSFGTMLKEALIAGKKLNASVVDMNFVKPLDENLIIEIAKTHKKIITIEDNVIKGGAGSAVSELLNKEKILIQISILGLPDEFTKQSTTYQMYGLNAENIIKVAQ